MQIWYGALRQALNTGILRPTENLRYERVVKATVDAFHGYTDPFADDIEKLRCISSGVHMPDHIEKNVLDAEAFGKEAREAFANERLASAGDFFHILKGKT